MFNVGNHFYFIFSMQTIQLKVTWVSFKLFLSLCYYVLIHVLIFVASDGL